MIEVDDKPARTPEGRFAKGHSGNPKGRPTGSRHKASLAVENMMEGEAEAVARATIDKAVNGDVLAQRLCLDRIAPRRKDRPISFELPPTETVEQAEKASAALLAAVANAELSASEAVPIMTLLVSHKEIVESGEHERRLARIEKRLDQRDARRARSAGGGLR